jgi:carbon monoxide dehydrogenase subunit G
MASLCREVVIDATAHNVWTAIRDFGGVQRLVPGFIVDCRLETRQSGEVRVVTFADGRVACELLVDLDDARRRLVYAEPGGRFITRSASVQVLGEGEQASRIVWTIDFLPNEFADLLGGNMDKATAIMKRTLEASAHC